MKIVKTAKLKKASHTNFFDDTIDIYLKALTFYIKICELEYRNYSKNNYNFSNEKMKYIEELTHKTATRTNIPEEYDFSINFYKFPSYLRRSVIMEAIGIVVSHNSRYKNWEEKRNTCIISGKKFYEKPPTLQYEPKSFPTFYKTNTFEKKEEKGQAKIKIFKNNDWIWLDISFNCKNLYSSKDFRFKGFKECNPSLVKKGKKYFLHFSYEKNVKLQAPIKLSLKEEKKEKEQQRIISVDLGLTNSAVCSCITNNGTVIDRLFINQSKEKDHRSTLLGKISKIKRISSINTKELTLYKKVNNLSKQIVQDTINKIVDFAIKNNVHTIVFEHLGKIKGKGSLKQKIHYWNKNTIQDKVKKKAHGFGIRFSRINPKNTSALAFDGSGKVIRNNKKDLCRFSSGKQYHSDLNASYNIASRYFIREYFKPLSEKKRLIIQAKVPELSNRSLCSLSSLIRLNEVVV